MTCICNHDEAAHPPVALATGGTGTACSAMVDAAYFRGLCPCMEYVRRPGAGDVIEVRIGSDDWHAATYGNQASPGEFWTMGGTPIRYAQHGTRWRWPEGSK